MPIETSAGAKTPWHLWAVGVISLLWNAYGGYDFVASLTQGEAYFRAAGMTDAQIAYFNAMPGWMMVPWAMGVWGSVAGSVLLLLRMRWALHAFVVSLVGLSTSLVYTYLLSNGGSVMGGSHLILNGVIFAALAFFTWYAWAMAKRGVLR
ncbi:hypothetical protein [Caulobacter sp. 17J80-11]|uniref:hypothetical protein n=1 Tax=Caulobacter sp. 17J80-11 TaxID=2763502 RepID=UPI0016535DE2|nr:hypothetical protein [Caulobacter sp. 17J80-11]MBC6980653.1 hypothetical protein [Caulobacter sp. 17J80-11]